MPVETRGTVITCKLCGRNSSTTLTIQYDVTDDGEVLYRATWLQIPDEWSHNKLVAGELACPWCVAALRQGKE